MVAYRLYCLDGTGRISEADWIEAKDDNEAVAAARRLKSNAIKCEIWSADRMVASLNHHDLADDSAVNSPAAPQTQEALSTRLQRPLLRPQYNAGRSAGGDSQTEF